MVCGNMIGLTATEIIWMSVSIRALAAADYDVWLPLWKGYQEFYKTNIPEEVTRVTFARILDEKEPMFAALAWVSGEAAGLAHWILHRSNWTVGHYCYLQDLYVASGRRGLGLGRELIEHVYAEAHKAGCARVHWLTHESNVNAMLLYDRIADRSGFVQYRKQLH
jgi:GNAT superfamily N-acetyltransferase